MLTPFDKMHITYKALQDFKKIHRQSIVPLIEASRIKVPQRQIQLSHKSSLLHTVESIRKVQQSYTELFASASKALLDTRNVYQKSFSSSLKAIQEMQRTYRRSFAPLIKTSKQTPLMYQGSILPTIKALQQTQGSFQSNVASISKSFNSLQTALRDIGNPILNELDTWKQISKSFGRPSSLLIRDWQMIGISSEIVSPIINTSEISDEKIYLEDFIQDAANSTLHEIERLYRGTKAFSINFMLHNGWLSIFFTVLFTVFYPIAVSEYFSSKNNQMIEQHFKDNKTLIVTSAQRIIDSLNSNLTNKEDRLYIVEATVNVRSKRNSNSRREYILYPGIVVNVINSEGQWALVEYFNFNLGVPKKGYIKKSTLRRLRKAHVK